VSTARVDFTRGAAERIAAVVRRVEQGDRDGTPLTFTRVDTPAGTMRIVAFTGAWGKSTLKTVTIDPTTATMTVSNIFASISSSNCSRKGAAARIGETWYLISAEGG